jgi:hypothetical protein
MLGVVWTDGETTVRMAAQKNQVIELFSGTFKGIQKAAASSTAR